MMQIGNTVITCICIFMVVTNGNEGVRALFASRMSRFRPPSNYHSKTHASVPGTGCSCIHSAFMLSLTLIWARLERALLDVGLVKITRS